MISFKSELYKCFFGIAIHIISVVIKFEKLQLLIICEGLPVVFLKLELEFNLSEILPVNCKFIRCSTPAYSDKTQTQVPEVWLKCKK